MWAKDAKNIANLKACREVVKVLIIHGSDMAIAFSDYSMMERGNDDGYSSTSARSFRFSPASMSCSSSTPFLVYWLSA